MRRRTAGTAEVLEGAGCRVRLDPFELPARVVYSDSDRRRQKAARQQVAIVGEDSVMIRRETGAGVPLYMTVPLSAYQGVLLQVRDETEPTTAGPAGETSSEPFGEALAALHLHHANPDLAVPLMEADDTDDVIADWQAWGRMLRRPLLIRGVDGSICEPYVRLGELIIRPAAARRANTFFRERRPRFLSRRQVGGRFPGRVYRETEIIARDTTD